MTEGRYNPVQDEGVRSVGRIFNRDFKWIFRDQPLADVGIDAQVEICVNGNPTGSLLALQIKSGESWFQEKTKDGFVYRGSAAHLEYWRKYALPVILVLYNPVSEQTYWQAICDEYVIHTDKAWKIVIPFSNLLNISFESTFIRHAERIDSDEIIPIKKYTHFLEEYCTGSAKRYGANVIINGRILKSDVKAIIKELTEELKSCEYYKNPRAKQIWQGVSTHIIWLNLFSSLDDVTNYNWFCRSEWISPRLQPEFSPSPLNGNDQVDDIVIYWKENYLALAQWYSSVGVRKEIYLDRALILWQSIKRLAQEVIQLTDAYTARTLQSDRYISQMQLLESRLLRLDLDAGEIGIPPYECKSFAQEFRTAGNLAHNISFPFSERGLTTWTSPTRDSLVRGYIKDYLNAMKKTDFELSKLVIM